MNIWYISKYVAPPDYTRVGTRGFHILKEFVKLGHNVTLYTSDSNHLAKPPILYSAKKDEILEGVCVRWIRTFKYSEIHSLARVISWLSFDYNVYRNIKNIKPDIIIISSLALTTIIVGLILKKKYNSKLVFEVRDIWPMNLYETGNYSKYNPAVLFLRLVEKLGYQFSDLIVGTMPKLELHVKKTIKKKKKVICIPHGIDNREFNKFDNNQKKLLSKFVKNKKKFIVCYAGSMSEDNPLETLITTAKSMINKKDIIFLLIGDGNMKNHYQSLVDGSKNIIFTGMLPKEEVTYIIKEVDILYFATHCNELSKYGQSLNKIIDYMAAGKVVIGSYSGYPSMINEANCGEFVKENSVTALKKAIERYYHMNEMRRHTIGMRGKTWLYNERTFDKLAKKYIDALEKI